MAMARDAATHFQQPIFHEPIFGEDGSSPDPGGFLTPHGSDDATYKKIGDLSKKDVVPIPPSRDPKDALFPLAKAYGDHGDQVARKITDSGSIIFHALGDSGASNAGKYPDELRVADQVTLDCTSSPPLQRPAFLFHLGDIVYNFGEARYYYDQFYEPFRNYPAPIFAIPGNHDSFIVPGTDPSAFPLVTFQRNFCAESPVITPEAGSLHRTAMIQPGVYFTLDAPFVRIIGLFSNALEDPGVISEKKDDKGDTWPGLSNIQLEFLEAQLKKIKAESYKGAVVLATHHPAFSYAPLPKESGVGGNHGCSTVMMEQIDEICTRVGVYPHAFLSGHAHNYQRYTRIMPFKINGKDEEINVPFIVCGDGGHNVSRLVRSHKGEPAEEPSSGADVAYLDGGKAKMKVKHLILAKYDDQNYGYLRIYVDKDYLKIGFHQVGARSLMQSRYDMVTVKLEEHHLVAN
jgi:hypothetical protein